MNMKITTHLRLMFPGINCKVNIEVEFKLLESDVTIMYSLMEILRPQFEKSFAATVVKHFQQFFLQNNKKRPCQKILNFFTKLHATCIKQK